MIHLGTRLRWKAVTISGFMALWMGSIAGCGDEESEIDERAQPQFVLKWGSAGERDGQFHRPNDVAVDDDGNVYVVDQQNRRIQKFTGEGRFVAKWAIPSGSPNRLGMDPTGHVLVNVLGDSGYFIEKYTSDGRFVAAWGRGGQGGESLGAISSVAADATGNVYAGDAESGSILKLSSDGRLLKKWGSIGSGSGQFTGNTLKLQVHPDGNLYVLDGVLLGLDSGFDPKFHNVQVFTLEGQFVRSFSVAGPVAPEHVYSAVSMAFSKNGNLYISYNDHRVQKFKSDGTHLTGWGSRGTGPGQFQTPAGIAVDDSDNIYVADRFNERIQKFH